MDHLLTKINQDQENGLIPESNNEFCQTSVVPVMATPGALAVAYSVYRVVRHVQRTQRGAELELY